MHGSTQIAFLVKGHSTDDNGVTGGRYLNSKTVILSLCNSEAVYGADTQEKTSSQWSSLSVR